MGGDAERVRLSDKTGEARVSRIVANDVSPQRNGRPGPHGVATGLPRPAADCEAIEVEIDRLRSPDLDELRTPWRVTFRSSPLPAFTKRLLAESKHPPAWDARRAPSTEDRGKNRMPPRGRVVGVL